MRRKYLNDVSIVLGGAAGQGIQTIQDLLTHILKDEGYHVFAMREVMSRVRGGVNSTEIRISNKRVSAYLERMDLFLPLNECASKRYNHRITDKTLVVDENKVPMSKISKELGSAIYKNIVAVGFILGLFHVDLSLIERYIKNYFKDKPKFINNNIKAVKKGYHIGKLYSHKITIKIDKNKKVKKELYMDGSEAIALGAIAGGCNFISSYPMSPSTGVLVNMAKHSKNFNVLVEQVEDELAAINMSLGAWYAGARGLVTTSGGGFDLMTEGLSLSGMIETPLVVHIAQRPGPATGLPTRTAQEDLNLALYAGHGEYPRVILAPGDAEEAFYLTQRAMNLADKYQVPVLILTDQFLVDSFYNVPSLNPSKIKNKHYFVKTTRDYKRYRFTSSGISPRGLPGYGNGLVCADSDEHYEDGHITEDHSIRNKMVEKRMRKLEPIKKEIAPEFIESSKYKTLVISWGSTKGVVSEALEKLNKKGVAYLHFKQVYPLPANTINYLKKAKKVVVVESNATGQFADLLRKEFGINPEKILKYSGLPFSVEELVEKLK